MDPGWSDDEKTYYTVVSMRFDDLCVEEKEQFKKIVLGDSKISLRMLDYYTSQYSPKDYNFKLEWFTKKFFDPFKRSCKCYYTYYNGEDDQVLLTSIGQMNFFVWLFENNILDTIEEKYDQLDEELEQLEKLEEEGITVGLIDGLYDFFNYTFNYAFSCFK